MAGQEGPGDLCKGMMKGARLDRKAEALKGQWRVRGKAYRQVNVLGGGVMAPQPQHHLVQLSTLVL